MEAREAQPPLADLDPYSCNLRLRGICATTPAELAAVFRLVPDQIRIFEIPSHAGPVARDGAGADDATALTRAVLEEQVLVLRTSGDREHDAGRIGSAMRAAVGALRHSRRGDLAESIGRAGAMAMSPVRTAALVAAIDEALRSLTTEIADSWWRKRGSAGFANVSLRDPPAVRCASTKSRIDALVDMAGELLVVKNGFAHLARRAEGESERS